MNLEVLHVPDCPNLTLLLERLRQVIDIPVTTREINSDVEAVRFGMAGSPTLLIDGVDPFAAAGRCDCGVSCRLYRDEDGRTVPAPSVEQLRGAIADADANQSATPAEVLSTWRTRALPLDPVERAVHQAILRTFAATGHPPAPSDLDAVTAGSGRAAPDVLSALHEVDAVRLNPEGEVAVAYPFSGTPTRHRVRIADQVDAYAMCAIDALGISAMLGEPVRIDSLDVTTGQPIGVTVTQGGTTWKPPGAVVFVGADAGGGPSAERCCDYVNIFTDDSTAQAWILGHPQVPGQVLGQAEAEELGARLFGPLLSR